MDSLASVLQTAEFATTRNMNARMEQSAAPPNVTPITTPKTWSKLVDLPQRWSWVTTEDPFGLGYVKCSQKKEAEIRDVGPNVPLAFVGPTGAGKTSVALWKAWQLFSNKPRHVLVAPVSRIEMERRKVQLGKPLPDFLQRCETVPVLILDDVGNEDTLATAAVRFLALHRHNSELQTWVTTSLTPNEFIRKYRHDIFRRFFRNNTRAFVLG